MLKVGFGQSDITPKVEGSFIGSVHPRPITRVHDPLLATACVIDDGAAPPIVLVGIDAGVIQEHVARAAQETIAAQTAIPRDNVLISASHTHQGGPVMTLFNAQADLAYERLLSQRIAAAVIDAWNARRNSEIASGFARVSGIHFNRRFVMRGGREATHPGKMNPDIVRRAGPVDEKVGVLAMRDSTSEIVGIVVNFGCHCTVTEEGTEYSADYVYYLRQHLREHFPRAAVVFLLGPCGDITQIDNLSPKTERGHAHADAMGAQLATEVARGIPKLTWHSEIRCSAVHRTIPIAIRTADASLPPSVGLGSGEMWERIFQREAEHVAGMRAQSPTIGCAIHAVHIGEHLAIVINGAELFCQPALDIQHASPFKQTWVVTLTNEYRGYVPTADAHHAGGYEPRTARSSFLAVDAAQRIVRASLEALAALR